MIGNLQLTGSALIGSDTSSAALELVTSHIVSGATGGIILDHISISIFGDPTTKDAAGSLQLCISIRSAVPTYSVSSAFGMSGAESCLMFGTILSTGVIGSSATLFNAAGLPHQGPEFWSTDTLATGAQTPAGITWKPAPIYVQNGGILVLQPTQINVGGRISARLREYGNKARAIEDYLRTT
jgi:hypothetical protein